MQIITNHLHSIPESKNRIPLPVDRRTLAKRRFRATASNGEDFGFDLPHPLKHETPFFETEDSIYCIAQEPEPILRVPFSSPEQAALYGWMIGNMHFPAAFEPGAILAEDDPAVRQLLERNHIAFEETSTIFQPPSNVPHHHHH